MFCIHCGQKLPDNAKFCNQCGESCCVSENEDNVARKANWELVENVNESNSRIDDDVKENAHWNCSSYVKEEKKDLPTYNTPEVIYFKVNKDYANDGECLFFSWDTKNATKAIISIENFSSEVLQVINVPERAEQQEIPIFFRLEDHIIIIKLQVYDVLGNKINYQNSLYIYKTENSHPVILSFSTSKYAIRDNETIELSWNVKNATRVTCSILEGELELYGKKTITISFREEDPMKIYLYAENEYGKEERSVNINLKNGFIFTLILVIFQIACYGFLGLKVLEMLIARLK